MTNDSLTRLLPPITVAATIAAFPTTDAAAQLVADAEFREACEVLRLGGALDVPEWLAFSRPPSLQLDPAGRLYLNAGASPTVTVVDSDGGFVRSIGGEGEGPGEFTYGVGGFGFVGDTVWLQDRIELHIAFFDSAGAHISTEVDRGQPSTRPDLWRYSIPLARGRGFYIPASGRRRYDAHWVVVGPDGEAEFRVPALTGITFKAALGDRVWGTGLTELDVPYIVQYELRSPGACG